MLFSAFNTCQNLASVVLEEDGLGSFGFYTLAALYFSLAFAAFLSSALMEKIGLYKCLVIGSFFHFTFVLVNLLPALHKDYPGYQSWLVSLTFIKSMLIVSAVMNGFGAGILWCAFGNYISECATEATKGYFNGLFWFFFMGSQTTGSLIGAFLLGEGFKTTYLYVILASIAIIAVFSFLFVRKPLPHKKSDAETKSDVETDITTPAKITEVN